MARKRLRQVASTDIGNRSPQSHPVDSLGPGLIGAPAALLQNLQSQLRPRSSSANAGLHNQNSVAVTHFCEQPGPRIARFVQHGMEKLKTTGEASLQFLQRAGNCGFQEGRISSGRRRGVPPGLEGVAAVSLATSDCGRDTEASAVSLTPIPALPFTPHWTPTLPETVAQSALTEHSEKLYQRSKGLNLCAEAHISDLQEAPARQAAEDETGREADAVLLCCESVGGFRKQYFARALRGKGNGQQHEEFEVVDWDKRPGPVGALISFAKSYVLPEGYPESVEPSYMPYMQWRAVQYFFGGAMSVFTTRSLLHSLGMSRGGSTSGALAVNWVIKDGAGRIGKMLFARHGKKFDCDLKQFRFAGDLLMELGAGVELATMAMPRLFLPLACAANVAKNVAAVTATSTRAPIYKAFARRENIGDVTAKGESISNLSDLLGTGLGILLSRRHPSLVATFCVLSCGYLLSSYQEVRAVQVPTLNRARFAVAVRTFLNSGEVPSLREANREEAILVMPWAVEQPLQVGARVMDAFSSPRELKAAQELFQHEKYLVTYRPSRRRAYVILKEGASSEHVLQAAFQAHVLLHILHKGAEQSAPPGNGWQPRQLPVCRKRLTTLSEAEVAAAVAESCRHTREMFESFSRKAAAQGWTMRESLLSTGNARLCC